MSGSPVHLIKDLMRYSGPRRMMCEEGTWDLVCPDLSLLHLVLTACILDIISKAGQWIRYLTFVLVGSDNPIFELAHMYRALNCPLDIQSICKGAKRARRLLKTLLWKKCYSTQGKYVWSNLGEVSVIQ